MSGAFCLSIRIGAQLLAVVAAVWVIFAGLAKSPAVEYAQPPRLNGTFFQFRQEHTSWTDERWDHQFEEFRKLRLSRVIVQWSMLDEFAFFRSSTDGTAANSPLETVLRLADEHGMEILVGLKHDRHFWDRIGGTPQEVDYFLRNRFADSLVVASGLLPLVSAHHSFKGWYISEEIDDLSWRNRESRRVLAARLGAFTASLHRLTPNAPIAVSGFASGTHSAADLQAMWGELLDAAPHLDSVLFQDGIGVGHLDLQRLPEYLEALRAVTSARGRSLEVITEVFEQLAGQPLDDKPFQAIPASLTRIDQQLRIAARYSSAAVAFSVPEYLSLHGGDRAAALYLSYLSRFRSHGGELDLPSWPSSMAM
jgi:hypothetical protein